MSLRRERGLVIEQVDLGDSDRKIALFTEKGEKIFLLCKGIRKSRKRPILATELGSEIEAVFYDKESLLWKSTKELHLIQRFDQLKSTYFGTLFVIYHSELLNKIMPEKEFHPALFVLLQGSFQFLESQTFRISLLPFFKIRLLVELGLFPKEFHCVSCGKEILEDSRAQFLWEDREFHCQDCYTIGTNHIIYFRAWDHFLRERFGKVQDPERSLSLEMDQVLHRYIQSILGVELKSYFEFYKNLRALPE